LVAPSRAREGAKLTSIRKKTPGETGLISTRELGSKKEERLTAPKRTTLPSSEVLLGDDHIYYFRE